MGDEYDARKAGPGPEALHRFLFRGDPVCGEPEYARKRLSSDRHRLCVRKECNGTDGSVDLQLPDERRRCEEDSRRRNGCNSAAPAAGGRPGDLSGSEADLDQRLQQEKKSSRELLQILNKQKFVGT